MAFEVIEDMSLLMDGRPYVHHYSIENKINLEFDIIFNKLRMGRDWQLHKIYYEFLVNAVKKLNKSVSEKVDIVQVGPWPPS